MSPARHAYQYATNGRSGVERGREPIDPTLLAPADGQLQRHAEVTRDRPVWAQDLLQVARAVFLADKLSLRAETDDRWTRRIDLSVQVAHADVWTEVALTLLNRLTETLTADRWTIRVHPGAAVWPQQDTLLATSRVEEAALFSGGLDSSAYAAERSRASAGDLLLVSYYEPQWGTQQDRVLTAIRRSSPRDIWQFKASQQVRAQHRELEPSARTRGLLYAATAVYLAAAHEVPRVAVPKNGQLGLNPALTAARVAACSTRSVHPYTLSLLNELICALGGTVAVVNRTCS
ncbi:hypothetical protein OG799_00880 [Micromonospora sp. NBC_00898]|uniref:hypothetical protein n=1 Tax=Micromonospora sp. NBC_00898 TaxID=2975981 RepID=UPI003863EC62|nr:hypothetical protein OG799_00880 [Micromonospora sp. NBC_00898]